MNVTDIMTKDPIAVRRDTDLDRAMELLDENDIRHLPVLGEAGPGEPASVVGVVSDRDVLEATGWLSRREREVLESPESFIGDIMRGAPATVVPDETVGYALGVMLKDRLECLPVVQDDALVGIVTETDILRTYVDLSRREDFRIKDDPPIDAHMSAAPRTVKLDTSGDEAAALMQQLTIRHLPVVDSGKVVGIVSDRDFRRLSGRGQLERTPVGEFMTPLPLVAQVGEPLSSVALVLSSSRISAVPVIDGERLAGIATTVDVMLPCALAIQRG